MSDLYTEAKQRVVSNVELSNVNDKFRQYFIEMMNYLSNGHKSNEMTNEMKTYRLYYSESDMYNGINLNKIRFRASNKYELWIKICDYFVENCEPDTMGRTYFEKLYYQYMLNEQVVKYYEMDHSNHLAMMRTIEFELDLWENSDTLWWEEEDIEYI